MLQGSSEANFTSQKKILFVWVTNEKINTNVMEQSRHYGKMSCFDILGIQMNQIPKDC